MGRLRLNDMQPVTLDPDNYERIIKGLSTIYVSNKAIICKEAIVLIQLLLRRVVFLENELVDECQTESRITH